MTARKILIIDDDPSVRECYGRLFRRQGYEPHLESSGVSVERNLEKYLEVKALVLDYRMPGLNGLELLRRLRFLNFRAAGVMVTAFATPEMIREAACLGIRRVFSKPVDIPELLRAVEEIFLPDDSGRKVEGDLLKA